MPAPIPPGYTRGPVLFVGARQQPTMTRLLHQWIWREAGGYGARMVVITVERESAPMAQALVDDFMAWECDAAGLVFLPDRATALNPAHTAAVEAATGIVLIGRAPLRQAVILGGTPTAQAIRRANARGKLVAGMDAAGAFLCQHVIGPGPQTSPTTLRDAVAFAPGLGLLNRLAVDATALHAPLPDGHITRLLAAVGANPFLVGVGLEPDSAAILYSDDTLLAVGGNSVTVVDGAEISDIDLDGPPLASSIQGEIRYRLGPGDAFNLSRRELRPAGDVDLPPTGTVTSAF
jgi:cyanophycinase